MKTPVIDINNKQVGEISLLDAVFGVEERSDILARMVFWQRAKARSGTRKTKGISDISGTTRKPWAQKGSGRARQGSTRSPQFRTGAVIFGPVVHDHAHELPKKFRRLALRMALSAKLKAGKLLVLDAAKVDAPKTKEMAAKIATFAPQGALFIDGANLDQNFALSVRNIPHVAVLPEHGANVYDILRHDTLVLTKNAVEQLQARLAAETQAAA